MANPKIPTLVAHRGYAAQFPENTLEAVSAALHAGVQHVEVDIQLTSDGVPVLIHDAELDRTTSASGSILGRELGSLAAVSAGEPQRFGSRFSATRIPTLAALVTLLLQSPRYHAFIEIKEESLARFGHDVVVARVLAELAPVAARCCVISYDTHALSLARRLGASAIGWVVRHYDFEGADVAAALAPDYLICNYTKLPPSGPLWSGPWRWMFYEVIDPELALALARRGADMIETMVLGAYLNHPAWRTTLIQAR